MEGFVKGEPAEVLCKKNSQFKNQVKWGRWGSYIAEALSGDSMTSVLDYFWADESIEFGLFLLDYKFWIWFFVMVGSVIEALTYDKWKFYVNNFTSCQLFVYLVNVMPVEIGNLRFFGPVLDICLQW